MRRFVLPIVLALAAPAAAPADPIHQDPLGRLTDVTAEWQRYQPSEDFCVPRDGFDFYSGFNTGPTCEPDEYHIRVETPLLCAGCRRLFIDYSQIPAENDPAAGLFYAHGHIYFRLDSRNFTYTVDPRAHSPNIKNLTNDKFVAPDGSIQEHVTHGFDLYAMSYVGDTLRFHRSSVQGPYYIGPAYENRDGEVIRGAYLDVDRGDDLSNPNLNAIGYRAGFNAGEPTCPDNVLFEGANADGNYFYAGCSDRFGFSATTVDPWA